MGVSNNHVRLLLAVCLLPTFLALPVEPVSENIQPSDDPSVDAAVPAVVATERKDEESLEPGVTQNEEGQDLDTANTFWGGYRRGYGGYGGYRGYGGYGGYGGYRGYGGYGGYGGGWRRGYYPSYGGGYGGWSGRGYGGYGGWGWKNNYFW